jgi:hypothetical protein
LNFPLIWNGLSAIDLVADFHHGFDHPIATTPITAAVFDGELLGQRRNFIASELVELDEAIEARDLVGVVDALQDLKYFIYGTELALGIPSEPCFLAVHDANMDKLFPDGKPRYREGDRKVIKPEGWVGPEDRIAEILIDAAEAGSPFQLGFDF